MRECVKESLYVTYLLTLDNVVHTKRLLVLIHLCDRISFDVSVQLISDSFESLIVYDLLLDQSIDSLASLGREEGNLVGKVFELWQELD